MSHSNEILHECGDDCSTPLCWCDNKTQPTCNGECRGIQVIEVARYLVRTMESAHASPAEIDAAFLRLKKLVDP